MLLHLPLFAVLQRFYLGWYQASKITVDPGTALDFRLYKFFQHFFFVKSCSFGALTL